MDVNTLYKDMMFSVLRLVTFDDSGDGVVGTGVLVDLESTPGMITPVLLTNRHVVADAVEISIHLPASDGPTGVVLGNTVQIRLTLDGERFFSPRDRDVDIAIIPFGAVLRDLGNLPTPPFVRLLPVSEFPSSDEYARLDALEEVVFIGFPDGRWDDANKTPIMRRGITATPAALCFDARPQFVIDASVFPGNSGSPVFVTRTTTLLSGSRLISEQVAIFVGIITGSLHQRHDVTVFETTSEVTEQLDLGLVANVGAVRDALDDYCAYASLPKPTYRTSPLGME